MTISDLGNMYDEAFAEWQADEVSVDWESLDQTNWDELSNADIRDLEAPGGHLN